MSHRHLILGLLMEQPMSGYDIKKRVQTVLGAVANASYGTLYPALHKLLDEGLVEMREVPQQSRPSKKVYDITQTGRQELLSWLREPPTEEKIQREFLLKLYLAKYLTTREVQLLLATRRGQTEAALRSLKADKSSVDDPQQAWMIGYALSMCEAEIEWLEQIEHQVQEVS